MVIGYINYIGISTVLVEILRVRKSGLPQRSSVITYLWVLLGAFSGYLWPTMAERPSLVAGFMHFFIIPGVEEDP